MAASWGTTAGLPVGSWKASRPGYVRHVAPCLARCPVGNDVEGFLGALRQGDAEAAARVLRSENPLPAVCGRVCFHPCESACNRAAVDGAVSIRAVERFLGDLTSCREDGASVRLRPATGKSVAILGSGPAGLACAWALRLLGHQATVLERRPAPGGLLRYGIPSYRLPKEVLDRELCSLAGLGIAFRCGITPSTDLADLRPDHDAIFVATGAALAQRLGLAADGDVECRGALDFLAAVATGTPAGIGSRCVVIGGGNSAIDAARSARRLGAEVTILYRRTRAEMPAFAAEVSAAIAEGARIEELAIPVGIVGERGNVSGVRCQRARLGDPDASGRPAPVPLPGSDFLVPADTVLNAIGETVDRAALTADAELRAALDRLDGWGVSSAAGVFGGGDFGGQPRTVADAIGSGKRAAMAIDRYLRQEAPAGLDDYRVAGGPASLGAYLWGIRADVVGHPGTVVDLQHLNTDYFPAVPRAEPARRTLTRPHADFDEIESTFDATAAHDAAARCFSCGRCTLCGNCLVFCPEGAVRRHPDTGAFAIADAHCKGCGICVEECPRWAIAMTPARNGSAT